MTRKLCGKTYSGALTGIFSFVSLSLKKKNHPRSKDQCNLNQLWNQLCRILQVHSSFPAYLGNYGIDRRGIYINKVF